MLEEAVECETQFAEDLLGERRRGPVDRGHAQYLEYVADQRLQRLGLPTLYGSHNPFAFMELQDVQELTNFFERRVSAYQVGSQRRRRLRRGVLTNQLATRGILRGEGATHD